MLMTNLLKFAFALFLIVPFSSINGQIRPKYVIGLNLSTLSIKTRDLSSAPKTPAGIHFGVSYEIPLIDNFTLRTGLLFSAKGADYKIDTVAVSISPIYIEIPLNAVYNFGSDELKISLFAGPYFAAGIWGYKLESGMEFRYISFGSGEHNDLKAFDFGFNFGTGVKIRDLLVSAQYGIGLANISPVTTDESKMTNKVIGVSISSSFPGKK